MKTYNYRLFPSAAPHGLVLKRHSSYSQPQEAFPRVTNCLDVCF